MARNSEPKTQATIRKMKFNYPIRGTTFGGMVELPDTPGKGLVILCSNEGGGWQPERCLLPHQIYVEDLDARRTWAAFPVASNEYFLICGDQAFIPSKQPVDLLTRGVWIAIEELVYHGELDAAMQVANAAGISRQEAIKCMEDSTANAWKEKMDAFIRAMYENDEPIKPSKP